MQGSQTPFSCTYTIIEVLFVLVKKQKDMSQETPENKFNRDNLITHTVKYEIFLFVSIVKKTI
jgi:hypothetical protein